MSKTTLTITPELHSAAKVLAAQKGCTLKALSLAIVSKGLEMVKAGKIKIEPKKEVSK